MMGNRISRRLLLAVVLLLPIVSRGQTITVDGTATGTGFNSGVRGMAVPALNITRGEYTVGIPKTLEVVTNSSIRGYAGGIEAEIFDWETRNGDARPSTLQYQIYGRDKNAELLFTVNMRGLTAPNGSGGRYYYDTSIATLTQRAADWVRYTNRISQLYRTTSTVTDTRDKGILAALQWTTSTAGDNWPKLLTSTQSPVPKVKYWEIGNEPRVGVTAYGVTNSYTFLDSTRTADATHKTDYAARYAAITAAMLKEDSSIKVGPCLVNGQSSTERPIFDELIKKQANGTFLPINFINYHPYGKLNQQSTTSGIQTYLQGIYAYHKGFTDFLRNELQAYGRDPNGIQLIASEVNISDWTSNDLFEEARQAHALGTVEQTFSFARLGVHASHYWVFPAHRYDGTEYPVFRAYKGLRDHMGAFLLTTYSSGNTRLYATRALNGEIALWGLNFDNSNSATLKIALKNVSSTRKVTLMTLGAISGTTSLNSANLSPSMTGGPTNQVDWKSTDLTGKLNFNGFNYGLPNATISILIIKP